MMYPKTDSYASFPRAALVVALLAVVCAAPSSAQDEPIGDLPFSPGGSMPGGGGGPMESGVSPVLTMSGEVAEGGLDVAAGAVRISGGLSTSAPVSAEIVADPDAALVQSSAEDFVRFEAVPDLVMIQGHGTLLGSDVFDATLVSADHAMRAAVLVLDDGSGTLADLVSEQTTPLAVVDAGELAELDLDAFAAMVAKADVVADEGMRVSVVMIAIDDAGGVRITAARLGGDGVPVEFLVQ